MKMRFFVFVSAFVSLLTSTSFAVEKSSEETFAEFEKSVKREFWQDGSMFTFNLSADENQKLMIAGDANKGANLFISVPAFISKTELGKLLPKLKENAEIKNAPCSDVVDENMSCINASDVEFVIKNFLIQIYASKHMEDIGGVGLKNISQKSAFAISFGDNVLTAEQKDDFLKNAEKIYEEFKGKNLLPDCVFLNFTFELFENVEGGKSRYKSEYLNQLKGYGAKNLFNVFDGTFYHLLKTDDAEMRKELKEFASANLKNSSSIAIFPIYSYLVKAFWLKKDIAGEKIKLAREMLGELSESGAFEKENDDSLLLNRILTDLDLLSENPDYAAVKNRLEAGGQTPFETIKLSYVFEKLGGEENLKKSRDLIGKFKGETDAAPPIFVLDAVFDKDYAKFLVKNFGISNYVYFLGKNENGKELFDEIKNDKSFNFSKEDLMKVKMRGYLSDIEACEVQEDPEDRKLAFKILKSYLENDRQCRNIGFLHYVLFCMSEGRNTEKDIEGAKKILREYLANIRKLPPDAKGWALGFLSEIKESRDAFVKDNIIKIKLSDELANIVKNYEKENRTSVFCMEECKKLLEDGRLEEAFKLYTEAVEKGYANHYAKISVLKQLSKILSDDKLLSEFDKIERGLKNIYFTTSLDRRFLEVFAYHRKYSALVKYLNSAKSVEPFIKDEIFAVLYKKGLGVPKDAEKSGELFKKAEALNKKQLELLVNFMYEYNSWSETEKPRKDYLNELLLEKNPDDINAILNLAGIEIPSHKTPEKFAKIDKLYQRAIHSPKYNGENLAYIYRFYSLEGRPSSDLKKAFEVVAIVSKIKTSDNRLKAMERLSTHYLEGLGVEKNEKKAVEILNEIVRDPDLNPKSYAYAALIYCMENEIGGLAKNEGKISEYYEKISPDDIFGITASLRSRHSVYRNRTPINRKFAAKFLNECVKRNIAKKRVLNLIYEYASENKKFNAEYRDEKLAWRTLLELEKLDPDDLAVRIRKIHHLLAGVGVEANTKEALKLLKIAEQKGSKMNAALTLAYIYDKGLGVEPDRQIVEECKKKLKKYNFGKSDRTITEISILYGNVLPYDKKWLDELKKELK